MGRDFLRDPKQVLSREQQIQFSPLCLRAANPHFLPQRALKFLLRNLKVVSLFYLLTHELLWSGLVCHAVPQGNSVSLLLRIVPNNLPWDERLCLRIKHYLCIILITRKLVSCICSYSWFLSHLFHNNNFERNILKKEMNKHKTCKSGKLMWDFRQVIYLPFWLSVIL